MSSGLVRCAFHSVLEIGESQDDSPRMYSARKFGQDILETVTVDEAAMTAFDEFSVEITECLRGIFLPNVTSLICSKT